MTIRTSQRGKTDVGLLLLAAAVLIVLIGLVGLKLLDQGTFDRFKPGASEEQIAEEEIPDNTLTDIENGDGNQDESADVSTESGTSSTGDSATLTTTSPENSNTNGSSTETRRPRVPVLTESAFSPEELDAEIRNSVNPWFSASTAGQLEEQVGEWLGGDYLLPRFVAVVNGVAEGKIIYSQLMIPPPFSQFKSEVFNDFHYLPDANFQRYDVYIELLTTMDVGVVAFTYERMLPELELAFADLGYPGVTFHERMLQALDYVIEAKVPQLSRIELTEPDHAERYYFYDEPVEKLPSVDKFLLRIGPGHTQRVKTQLRILRKAIARI